MSRPINVSVGPLASASANNIALSQSPAGAGNLTLAGSTVVNGVAILDTPRRILITSGGNDSATTFTIYGTDWNGQTTSESLLGSSGGTVFTKTDFGTVTRVSISAASGGTVTVGTNTIASSRPILLDPFGYAQLTQQVVVTGTITAGVENTLDDFIGFGEPAAVAFTGVTWIPDGSLGTPVTSNQSTVSSVPLFTRITMTAGTGSARYTVIQPASPS